MGIIGENVVTLDEVFVKAESKLAWLCEYDDMEFWLPKSLAECEETIRSGQAFELTVPEWFAMIEELI